MRNTRRMVVALAASAILVAVMGAGSAQALTIKPCSGAGTITTSAAGPPWVWTIDGAGSCPAHVLLPHKTRAPHQVSFHGVGKSDTLGLCDRSVLVQNLLITVAVSYRNVVTGTIENETQFWHAPITLFPLATPYLMTKRLGHGLNSGLQGAGIAITRVNLACGNGGTSPAASFAWVELRQP